MTLHLLALLDRAPRARVDGIDGRVRFTTIATGVTAAVEPRRRAPAIDERTLLAHDTAIRRLCELAGAVLPARFAAPLASETALREALSPRLEEIRQALERVRGREQMSLRVMRSDARPRSRAKTGRGYLEARREALTVPALDPVREAVRSLVREERIEPHDTPPLLATVHHLVDRGEAARYRSRVEAALAAEGAPPVAVRGPFPPYAFVTEER